MLYLPYCGRIYLTDIFATVEGEPYLMRYHHSNKTHLCQRGVNITEGAGL